jgi:protein SCO1/2
VPGLKVRRFLLVIFYFLGLAAITPALAHHNEAQRVNRVTEGWPTDAFSLLDHHSKEFTQDRLRGRWTFVLLGDTHCAEPCVAALSALAGMCRRIAPTEALRTTQVLFISLDPERDTPTRLQKYLATFDERFIGATGSKQTLRRLVDDLNAPTAAQAELVSSGNSGYSGSLLLIGPDGVVRAEFLPPFDMLRLTAEYLKTRARK